MKITKNLSQVAVILETELLKGSFLNDVIENYDFSNPPFSFSVTVKLFF